MVSVILAPLCKTPSKGIYYLVVTECMTEASEESNRNRPYFQQIISEHLAIEKTICKRKKNCTCE